MAGITLPEGTIKSQETLVGINGNAFAIMGTVTRGLRRAGNDPAIIEAFTAEATSGDYDHVIQTALAYTDQEAAFGDDDDC